MTSFLVKLFIKDHENVSDNRVRGAYGLLAGIMGVILNALLFGAKLTVGLLSGSVAVTADAFNNLSDAGSSVISMVGFRLANKPVDKKHPFGHGRMEYLSGLIVSLIIILVGGELIMSSVEKIFSPTETDVKNVTLIILGASVLVKIWMFYYNYKLSKRVNSLSMKATAMDSLTDSVATLVVLICAVIMRFTSVPLDGYTGVLVALFILYTGIRSAKETVDQLIGVAPDPSFLKEIVAFVTSYDIVVGVHDLIVHNYGVGRELISLHAEVPCDEDILYVHEKIDEIESALAERFGLHAVIHMDPIETNDEEVKAMKEIVNEIVKGLYVEATIHDFRMVSGENRTNLIFDVVVPYECERSEEQIISSISDKVKQRDKRYFCVISVDRPFC